MNYQASFQSYFINSNHVVFCNFHFLSQVYHIRYEINGLTLLPLRSIKFDYGFYLRSEEYLPTYVRERENLSAEFHVSIFIKAIK